MSDGKNKMRLRKYVPSDAESVVAIFRSNIPKYFTMEEEPGLLEFLSSCIEHYYVLELDGRVVGAGGFALNSNNKVSLCWGMVHNDHLGTGLGKALTDYRIARSREIFGGKAMVTSTSQHTEGFYRRYGFVTIEHTPDGFAPGIDNCRMILH